MSQPCHECNGTGDCSLCDGTGSIKELVSHPSPWDVDEDGEVPCTSCGGDGKCTDCNGTGEEDDD